VTHISRSALVPYAAEAMFDLVDDVPAYPEFLPWCKGAYVLSDDGDEVTARLEIAKGAFQQSFTTVNRRLRPKMLEMRLVEGPFRHLEGFWRFEPLDEGACRVSLDIDFEFSSKVLGLTLGPVFKQIANTLVDAFVQRARVVYG